MSAGLARCRAAYRASQATQTARFVYQSIPSLSPMSAHDGSCHEIWPENPPADSLDKTGKAARCLVSKLAPRAGVEPATLRLTG
jgi:hypothetical protein